MILKRLVEVINRKNKLRYNLFNNNYLIFYEFFAFFFIYINKKRANNKKFASFNDVYVRHCSNSAIILEVDANLLLFQ